ncbi:hypothetical protein COTS27_00335 [Spirochaetota bacterium]|nr:hypothetical protein COTS27_00335 [Spirochaetota bacterium]
MQLSQTSQTSQTYLPLRCLMQHLIQYLMQFLTQYFNVGLRKGIRLGLIFFTFIGGMGFFTACNVANPDLDFYRTTIPEKTTNYAYSNATIIQSVPPDLPTTVGGNAAATNYVFFHEFREPISYLNGAVSLDNIKSYDVRLFIEVTVTNDTAGNPAQEYRFTNTLSGDPNLNIAFYEIGTNVLITDLFTGDLSIVQTSAPADSGAARAWNISLSLMRTPPDETNTSDTYAVNYTFTDQLFISPP